MYSVTQRIKAIKQPRGGYIKPKEFKEIVLDDGIKLNPNENIHASLIGLSVDYLPRFMTGTVAEEAFHISLLGSNRVNERKNAERLVSKIEGLDDKSIINGIQEVSGSIPLISTKQT